MSSLRFLITLIACLTILGCGARDSLDAPGGAGAGGSDGGGGSCADPGERCTLDGDCCEGSCDGGSCSRPECSPAGEACQSGATCCSGACGPDGTCLETCVGSGQPCSSAAQCCSLQCAGNVCVDQCVPLGGACNVATQCCTGNCAGGTCVQPCAPNGFDCNTPGDCCSGVCQQGFCAGCLPNGSLCANPGDCCTGICDLGVCGGACAPNGEGCFAAEDCCSGSCNFGTCGPPCAPNGFPCMSGAECCAGICEAGFCGVGQCNHSECQAGEPLSPACNDCASIICQPNLDPFCCQVFWDELCVQEAQQFCGCGMCSPNGTPCNASPECCSGNCNANGICTGPAMCAHGPCEQGPPLDPNCSACVNAVCQQDPFCCQGQWDFLCVDLAETLCGLQCGMCNPNGSFCNTGPDCCSGTCEGGVCVDACLPDGSMCASFDQCCSNVCTGGVCSGACSPDGSFCGGPDECCSGLCIAGFCGPSQCPSDGSPCGDCVATNCCSQILGCVTNPGCIDDITCFFGCIGGGGPLGCLLQCVDSPQAFQTLLCIGQSCGPGTCF